MQQPDSQQGGTVDWAGTKKKTPLQAVCQANDEETKKKGRASRNNELREVPLMLIW